VVQAAAKHWDLASEENKPEREVLSKLESKAESLQIPHIMAAHAEELDLCSQLWCLKKQKG
jgi:hypothetical protein